MAPSVLSVAFIIPSSVVVSWSECWYAGPQVSPPQLVQTDTALSQGVSMAIANFVIVIVVAGGVGQSGRFIRCLDDLEVSLGQGLEAPDGHLGGAV